MNRRPTYRTSIPAIVLLSIYLLNPLKLCLPYLDYKVNYDFIVKFLCENKAKPEVNCNGKCYLSKALKDNQEKQSTHQRIVSKNYFADELLLDAIILNIGEQISDSKSSILLENPHSIFQEISVPPPKGKS